MAGNSVQLIGRLVADPDLRFTDTGKAVCDLSIAVDRRGGETDFFDITAWNGLAESLGEHKNKGDQIAVDGRLQQDRWDADDGSKRTRVRVVAHSVQFLARKRPAGADDDDPTDEPF